MRVGGCDPGANGAITVVCGIGPMAATTHKLANLGRLEYIELVASLQLDLAVIEKVTPMPARDKKGQPRKVGTKSMFTFGAMVERLHMAMAANGIPVREVPPPTWQKGIGLFFPKGATYADRKRLAQAKAQEMFARKVPQAVADSMLIAEYGRMIYGE